MLKLILVKFKIFSFFLHLFNYLIELYLDGSQRVKLLRDNERESGDSCFFLNSIEGSNARFEESSSVVLVAECCCGTKISDAINSRRCNFVYRVFAGLKEV